MTQRQIQEPIVEPDDTTDVNSWGDSSGGGFKFVDKNWRKNVDNKHGNLFFSFPLRCAEPITRYLHTFPLIQERDKDGKPRLIKAKSWTSPDPNIINKFPKLEFENREFRLEHPAVASPFLLLLPWLRTRVDAGDIHPDQTIFAWRDPNPGRGEPDLVEWKAKYLAMMVDMKSLTMEERDATLLPSGKTLFTVIPLAAPGTPEILEVPRRTGDNIISEVRRVARQYGERGDSFKTPLAWLLAFDGTQTGNGMYTIRQEAQYTIPPHADRAIRTAQKMDISQLGTPRRGDKALLRRTMQAAATEAGTYDLLPWDLLFNDAWKDDGAELPPRDEEFSTGGTESSSGTTRRDAGTARNGIIAPPPRSGQTSVPPASTAQQSPASGGAAVPAGASHASAPVAPAGARQPATPPAGARQPVARQPVAPPPPPKTLPTFNGEPAVEPQQLADCVVGCTVRQHPSWRHCPSCNTEFAPLPGWPVVNPPTMVELQRVSWPGVGGIGVAPTSAQPPGSAHPSPAATEPDVAPKFDSSGLRCLKCRLPLAPEDTACSRCGTSAEIDVSNYIS